MDEISYNQYDSELHERYFKARVTRKYEPIRYEPLGAYIRRAATSDI